MIAGLLTAYVLSLFCIGSGGDEVDYFDLSIEQLSRISVVSASRQWEPLREVPVPVTVLTAEMIHNSGARNLFDLLLAMVPGMTHAQDHNELNVAMRGIYGSSQQKFLILIEGHRLNTRVFSEGKPDYSIGLDKIQQIEVLRGPGSSLYGNVALTAVVNIILKKGEDVNGASVKLAGGNYGQQGASVLYGDRFGAMDLLVWGDFFESEGEKRFIPASQDYLADEPRGGFALLDRFSEEPSYDAGIRLLGKHWQLFLQRRSGKYSSPFSDGGPTGEIIDYLDIPLYRGVGPGLQSSSLHANLEAWFVPWNGANLKASIYTDDNKIVGGLVVDATIPNFGAPNWHEHVKGFQVQLNQNYRLLGTDGDLLLGGQLDEMRLVDSSLGFGTGDRFFPNERPLMEAGEEENRSIFLQVKQRLSPQVLVNLGFRYDHKNRSKGRELVNLAPRMALLFLPGKRTTWKLSYASSFVDAPYWYRFNLLPSYRGGADLKPEYLDAFQLTASHQWDRQSLEANIFHNTLTDFVFRDPTVPLGALDIPIYRNAGELQSVGLELVYAWVWDNLKVQANGTWQRALEARDYGERDGEIFNIPSVTGNFHVDWRQDTSWSRLGFHGSSRYIGSQLSPILIPSRDVNLADNRVAATLLVDAGLTADDLFGRGLNLEFRVHNLLDKEYFQGGSVAYPYPQPGRWWQLVFRYCWSEGK